MIAKEYAQLTAVLKPLSESLSHFMKSDEGATGASSTLNAAGSGAGFAGTGADARTVDAPFAGLGVLEAIADADEEGVIVGRTAAAATAPVLPLAPTVVHAPPAACARVGTYTREEELRTLCIEW